MPTWMAKTGGASLFALFLFVVGCSQNSPVGFDRDGQTSLLPPLAGLGTPPLAIPDLFTVVTDSQDNALNVLANDIDNSGTGLSISAASIALSVPDSANHQLEIVATEDGLEFTPAPAFVGVVTLNYTVIDGENAGAVGIATVTVLPVAPPPVTVPDVFTVQSNGPESRFAVTANDLDFSGAGLTVTNVTPQLTIPAGASGTVSVDGSDVLYTPAAGFVGVETLEYTVEDGNGIQATGLITITVLPVSAPPIAVPDAETFDTGSTANLVDVLANDVDLSGTGLTLVNAVTASSVPAAGGEVIQIVGNQIEYTPPAGFSGLQTITYTVEDGLGNSSTGTLLATVLPTLGNPPPVAVPDVVTAETDSADNTIAVLSNDVDVAGGGLNIINASVTSTVPGPNAGTVNIAPDSGSLLYTPAPGFIGAETLSYAIEDANGSTATGVVTVTVLPVPINLPPVAVPDIAVVDQDSGVNNIDVLANDQDSSASGLTISDVSVATSAPAGAAGVVSTDGATVSYTPPAGFFGVQVLNYEITDGNGQTATSAITITVSPVPTDLPPVAVPDIATVDQDSAGNSIAVIDNDLDTAGGGLTLTAASAGTSVPNTPGATVNIVANEVVFTPPAGFAGVQVIDYTITDTNGTTANGALTVTVTPALNGVPPVAIPDVALVDQDSANNLLDVIANDIDPAGGGLTLLNASVASSVPPAAGDVTGVQGNQVNYTPPPGFAGVQVINYSVEDANGATSTGALTVTVQPAAAVGDPVAVPDLFTVNQDSNNNALDVTPNDLDISGTGITLTAATLDNSVPPAGAAPVIGISGGQILYSPPAGFAGAQTINYTITDGAGGTASGLATVTVQPVGGGNPPPVALPDTATVDQDSNNNLIDVVSNDVDSSGTGLTLSAVSVTSSVPAGGGEIVGIQGNQVNYSPPAGFAGVQVISYTITDGNGETSNGVLTITVTPPPPLSNPLAVGDAFTVNQDSTNNALDVVANDVDVSGTGLTLTAASLDNSVPANNNAVVGISGGQILYSPPAGFSGVQTLSYTITDGNGDTSTGLATVTVTPAAVQPAPVATPDLFSVTQDSNNNSLDVVANDVSPSGSALTLVSATLSTSAPPAAGEVIAIVGNAINYTPPAAFSGVQSIEYVIEDADGLQSTGLASVTVTPLSLNPSPVAIPDAFTVPQGSSNNDFSVLDNDVDAAGNGISLTSVSVTNSLPAGNPGSVSVSGNNVRYTPDAAFSGVETLEYVMTAADGQTSTGTVTVTVTPAALSPPPITAPDAFSVEQDSVNTSFDVVANDTANAPGALTLTAVSITASAPANPGGTVVISGNNVVYTPPAGFVGSQTLSYSVENSVGGTADGVVTVAVTAAAPDPSPVALPDSFTVDQDSVNNLFDVVANDVDPAGGGLSVSAVSITSSAPPAGGTAFVSGNQIAYSPPAGFSGVQTIGYTITDTNGNTGTGSVQVTVVPPALSPDPVAAPDAFSVQQDSVNNSFAVVDNDVDTTSTGLTLTAVVLTSSTPANNGQTLAIAGNNVIYTPDAGFAGSQVLTYTITDGNGGTSSAQVAVTVASLPIPVPPVPLADLVNVAGGSVNNSLTVLSNDIGPGLTITGVAPVGATSGTMGVAGDGSSLIYTPPGGALPGTSETFSYTIRDSNGTDGAVSATVTILIL